jgi:hypothetical protein
MNKSNHIKKCKYINNKKMSKSNEEIGEQFTAQDWLNIEVPTSKFEERVLECLKTFFLNDKGVSVEYVVMGEQLFNIFCSDPLNDGEVLPFLFLPLPRVNNKNKKLSKKEEIRIANSLKKVKEQYKMFLEIRNINKFQPKQIMQVTNIIEMRGVAFMIIGKCIIENKETFLTKKKFPEALEIIVAIQKFINSCVEKEIMKGKSIIDHKMIDVSQLMINNLENCLDKLKTLFYFDGNVVSDYAPQLLIYTDYDVYIPKRSIMPRQHQIDLIDVIIRNLPNGFVIVYNAMIGSGKTVSSIAIASLIMELRKKDVKYKDLELLFCCNIKSVKDQVANLCYNAEIKFGIATFDKLKQELFIHNHNTCKKHEDRIVLISSPEATCHILSHSRQDKYVLFLDEPTIGADGSDIKSLTQNVSVMSVLPKYSILSSATFPNVEKINEILLVHKALFPDGVIKNIYSKEIQIGCNIRTFEGDLVVPHLGVKNQDDLLKIIQTINECPFLGRTYTIQVVKSLCQKMKEEYIFDLFDNIDKMSSDGVRIKALELLNILTTRSDGYIKDICKSIIFDKKKIEFTKEQEEEEFWKNEDDNENDKLDFNLLGTKQSYRFNGTTLIATENPFEFAKKHFRRLIDDIFNGSELKNISGILKKYEQELKMQQKFVNKLDKLYKTTFDSGNKTVNTIDDKLTCKREDKESDKNAEKMRNKMDDIKEIKIMFPEFGHINSKVHNNKYARTHCDIEFRSPLKLDDIDYANMLVDDDILTLLFAGVGIYSNSCNDKVYETTVLKLANEGRLAFLVADGSICYGTNYPITCVIVTDEFMSNHSLNTLFQVMGRAGRVGKSWVANAYISRECAKKIINYRKEEEDMQESKLIISIYKEYINRK